MSVLKKCMFVRNYNVSKARDANVIWADPSLVCNFSFFWIHFAFSTNKKPQQPVWIHLIWFPCQTAAFFSHYLLWHHLHIMFNVHFLGFYDSSQFISTNRISDTISAFNERLCDFISFILTTIRLCNWTWIFFAIILDFVFWFKPSSVIFGYWKLYEGRFILHWMEWHRNEKEMSFLTKFTDLLFRARLLRSRSPPSYRITKS